MIAYYVIERKFLTGSSECAILHKLPKSTEELEKMNKKFNGVSDKILRKRYKIASELLDTNKEIPNHYLMSPERFKEYVEKLREQASIDVEEISKEMTDRLEHRKDKDKYIAIYRRDYSRERRYKIAIGDWESSKRTGVAPSLSSVMEEHEVAAIISKEQLDRENEEALRKLEEEIANVPEEEVKRQLEAAQAYDTTVESYNQKIEAAKALKDYKLMAAITLEKLAFIKANKP